MGDTDNRGNVIGGAAHSSLIEKLRKSHCGGVGSSPESDFASALYGLSGHVGQLHHDHHSAHRGLLNANGLGPGMDGGPGPGGNHHFGGKCEMK